jgi:hypothetical protein
MLPLPDVNSQASAALMVPSMPTISVSHFSAISIDDQVPVDVLSLTDDDDEYSPAVSADFVEKLSKEVLPDAVCWFNVEPNSDSSSSSSRPSSTGPETPRDCEDGLASPVKILIRKRKMFDGDEEMAYHSKQIVKRRWSASSNVNSSSFPIGSIYIC